MSLVRGICDAHQIWGAREQISAVGLYGKRLCMHQGDENDLPYQDYVANLIVVDLSRVNGGRLPDASTLHRLLRPGGYPLQTSLGFIPVD